MNPISLGINRAIVAVSRVGGEGMGVILAVDGEVLTGDLEHLGSDASAHVFFRSAPEDLGAGLWCFEGELGYDRWRVRVEHEQDSDEGDGQDHDDEFSREVVVIQARWDRSTPEQLAAVADGRDPFKQGDSRGPAVSEA